MIHQYRLIEQTTAYSVSNARRAYLPQVSLSAQATYQSDVASFPEQMLAAYQQLGIEMKGLNREQYRTTVEVNQTIWDGGAAKSQRLSAQSEGDVERENLEVEIYALRERINSLYFGILLLEKQIEQSAIQTNLLIANRQKVESLLRNGSATQSDVNAVEVELLTAQQQRTQLESTCAAYRAMLSIFIGQQIAADERLPMPALDATTSGVNNRPELRLFDAQSAQFTAQASAIKASTRPRIGLFAQGFYGLPGLNMFHDMMYNQSSWNYIVGVKMQWNFGAYYTRRNSLRRIDALQQSSNIARDTFMFNTSLTTTQQQAAIDKMQRIMRDDARIVELRRSIRQAEESKLANGTVDINDLLREITAEHTARLNEAAHEVELLKNIYDLKTTLND